MRPLLLISAIVFWVSPALADWLLPGANSLFAAKGDQFTRTPAYYAFEMYRAVRTESGVRREAKHPGALW